MLNTISGYVELSNKLNARAIELLSEKDVVKADKEIVSIQKQLKAERPKVIQFIYKKNKASGRLEKVGELSGRYMEGGMLFISVMRALPGVEFDIVDQKDSEGHTAITQIYKVNEENYTLTFTRGKTMQDCFTEWAKNLKTNLNIVSSTGIEHKVIYNKDFDTVDFY